MIICIEEKIYPRQQSFERGKEGEFLYSNWKELALSPSSTRVHDMFHSIEWNGEEEREKKADEAEGKKSQGDAFESIRLHKTFKNLQE